MHWLQEVYPLWVWQYKSLWCMWKEAPETFCVVKTFYVWNVLNIIVCIFRPSV